MGEVVGFRGKGRDRAEAETAEREARRERAAALRAVLDKNEPMNPEDQMLVAEALWRLLERAERQGVRKARVLRAAGIGSEGDSTKHLAQYALDTAWPRERKEKARLTKKPGPYRRITEEAAKLTAGDADEAILEVFGGTSLATSGHVAEAEPEYEVLARTLREVVEAVAAKHGLQDYFQAVARAKPALCVENYGDETNGHKLDPDEIELHFVPAACSLDWPVEFGKAGRFGLLHDGDSSVPPYPAIVLGKPGIGNSSSVRIESDEFPCEGEYGASPFCGKTSISYSAELRLCIVPTGPEMHPTAALRIELDALMYPLYQLGIRLTLLGISKWFKL